MESSAMTALLTTIGEVLTSVLGWAGDVATFITSNPLTILGVSMVVIGFSVGILARMISARA